MNGVRCDKCGRIIGVEVYGVQLGGYELEVKRKGYPHDSINDKIRYPPVKVIICADCLTKTFPGLKEKL